MKMVNHYENLNLIEIVDNLVVPLFYLLFNIYINYLFIFKFSYTF